LCGLFSCQKKFEALRATLFATRADLLFLFRHVIVNIVLANDIFDKELNYPRKNRSDRAFGDDKGGHDLRAKIVVVRHIMQALDVSHTTRHWPLYVNGTTGVTS
jgi:hypothetical protein